MKKKLIVAILIAVAGLFGFKVAKKMMNGCAANGCKGHDSKVKGEACGANGCDSKAPKKEVKKEEANGCGANGCAAKK